MKKMLAFSLSIFLMLFFNTAFAQGKKKNKMYSGYQTSKSKPEDRFLKTQWWLGFRAGANATKAEPTARYSGFSPVNYNPELNEKEYNSFDLKGVGGMAGLEITFYHHGFSFSLQPNYRRQRFTYINDYEWEDIEIPDNRIEIHYEQAHQLDYIEIPLFIKYDLTRGSLRPFIQIGGYYATLVGASKNLELSGTDYASGNAGPFQNQKSIIGARDLFIKSSIGVAGGVGLSYDVWNIRLVFDATYRYGLNNITDTKNRYSENQLVSIGDAMDDIEIRNISVSLGLLFPLRFISKNYDAFN